VILSTHIVEDVSDLCSHMAIISEGRVILTGKPADAISDLQGQVWQKIVTREELENYKGTSTIISTRLLAGRTIIHVKSPDSPGSGFVQVEADLKDVYFSTLRQAQLVAA
jgi:ABC-2 type transport system ATP-binding protein